MMENIERQSVLENSGIRVLITDRNIKPEDVSLIKELASFDKNYFIECLHNMFNMYRERSEKELESCIKFEKNPEKISIYEKALEFLKRYDWSTAWHMVRAIEEL